MSWQPSTDPEPGDRKACDALEMVIVPRARDIGAFEVKRALPYMKRRMVGPFIFLDQMGPADMAPGAGMDVRPHPHIGLATVTYLFDGAIMHRDSLGNVEEILPGAMNLMTAGRGIAHSERSPDIQRRDGQRIYGIQSWVALPTSHEETAPSFQHFGAEGLPIVEDKNVRARVIAGSAFGATSHVKTLSDWFYVDVSLGAGATVPLDPDYEERAIYLSEGEIEIAGERFEASKTPRLPARRPHHGEGGEALAHDVPRRRGAGRPALCLVELRLIERGAHRAGKGRLEKRPLRRGRRRDGIHSAAGEIEGLPGVTRISVQRRVCNRRHFPPSRPA